MTTAAVVSIVVTVTVVTARRAKVETTTRVPSFARVSSAVALVFLLGLFLFTFLRGAAQETYARAKEAKEDERKDQHGDGGRQN